MGSGIRQLVWFGSENQLVSLAVWQFSQCLPRPGQLIEVRGARDAPWRVITDELDGYIAEGIIDIGTSTALEW